MKIDNISATALLSIGVLAIHGVPSTHAAAETTLAREIPAIMQKAGVPGLSIAVLHNGKIAWTAAYGIRSAQSKLPVTDDTVFSVGSLSKPVFAYGVLKLVDAGKLKLDEPLAPYLPAEFTKGDPRFHKITARIVLSHRTGFPNWPGDGQPLTIAFNPGERFSYSGAGIVFLQFAIEKITGEKLNDYMQHAVFTPLAMHSSSYIWQRAFDNNFAAGHNADGTTADPAKADQANAASSLETTAADYALFLQAVLTGKGLRPETLREMETAQIAVDPGCVNCLDDPGPRKLSTEIFWGLGFGIQKTADGETLWHWGNNGPFKSFFALKPETKSGVVYLTNSENGLSIGPRVVGGAIGGAHPAFTWLNASR